MLTPFIRKLEAFGPPPDGDKWALELATGRTRWVGAGRALMREGERPTATCAPCTASLYLGDGAGALDGAGRGGW